MTQQEVLDRVEVIKQCAHDDERAHGMEDDLREDVLAAIAQGAQNPEELAAIALSTKGIRFARWCA